MSKKFYIYNLGIGKYTNDELTKSQLILLSCLIHICKAHEKKFPTKKGCCFLTNSQLSKETGLSKPRIQTHLDELAFLNYIEISEENNIRTIKVCTSHLKFIEGTSKGFFIPKDILTRKDLTISEKLIFGYITSFGFNNKDVSTRNDTLQKMLKIKSRSTISIALKKFKELGLINVSYSKLGENTGSLAKRNIKVNKEAATNFIQNNITNNNTTNNTSLEINNITNNTDNRVINYYISLTKDEYEEFLKSRNIDNIINNKNT